MTKNGSKGKEKDPLGRVRKIGEREEQLEVKLTQVQIDDMHRDYLALVDEEQKVDDRLKEVKKNYAAQLESIELQKKELHRQIRTGRRTITVVIEEHLTDRNEVIRIRQDNGDGSRLQDRIVGNPRTATARELQEDLPLDPPNPPNPPNDPEGDPPEFDDGDFATTGG